MWHCTVHNGFNSSSSKVSVIKKEGGGFLYLFTLSKMSTRLANLKKLPNIPNKLRILYGRILHLTRKLPRNVAYKINTEAIICHRLSVLEEAGNDEKVIEERIGCGNIMMLFRQAEEEYTLVQKMLMWMPWEPLKEKPPPGQWTWPPC